MARTPAQKAARRKQSLAKIKQLVEAGTPFNPLRVSEETLEIAGPRVRRSEILARYSQSESKSKRKKNGYR